MSDNARELLILGVEAAKANSVDEARHYLEWVLNTDADIEQEADAWYWLSRIAPDHVEKRSCLESALAANPRYPEARRDLAILDGRLAPDQMPDLRYPVQPLVPSSHLEASDLLMYKCPRCGATMSANSIRGGLKCNFCGYTPGEPGGPHAGAQSVLQQAGEQDWTSTIFARKGHRWEVPVSRTFTCDSCGATVMVPAGQSSTQCPFCATPHIVHTGEEQRDLIEPTGVLPFALSASDAFARIVRWLQDAQFVPEGLSKLATQSVPRPVYLPVWTYDIEGDVRWSGYTYQTEFGRSKKVRVGGSAPLLFDDVLVPGTKSVEAVLLDQLKFETNNLLPFSPDMLASWPTEIYSISAADASVLARERALRQPSTTAQLETSLLTTGTAHETVIETTDFSIISYKLALLPVWIGAYTFEGETYQVVVNGSSGEVAGNVPRNKFQQLLNDFLG
ncbi:MAG: hypothetical protein ABI670_00410 [Chloroflexota bacterium]